ncbi:DNA ligase 1-like [Capsicum annuum]
MGRKNVIPKRKDDTAGSSRKRRAAAVEKVSKRKKIEESVSELDSELKEISDYVDSSEDVAKRSVSGDSEECEGSESNSDDGDNDSLSVPYLSRCIFVQRYDLRTIIDKVGSFPAKISVISRKAAYQEFKQILVDQELKKRFKRSCFGHLRNLPEHLKFNGQLVHYFLLRRVKNDKMRHEMWFCVNNKPACFGLKEFCLITGLNCLSYPSESKMKKVLAKWNNFCFKVTEKKKITAANLLRLIRGNKLNEDQNFKCCLLWFLHTMLLAKDSTKVVDTILIRMVDSLSFFEKYPWGKETFQLTMD